METNTRRKKIEFSSPSTANLTETPESFAERAMGNVSDHTLQNRVESTRVIQRCSVARDEMNLAEFPLAVLSTRSTSGIKTLEFRDTVKLKNGELVEREWVITGADKFGLPTSTDDDVILGLMCLTMERGFRERKIFFSRYELLKILQWSTEGRSYQRLSKSLDRLSGVCIRSTNAFFDNKTKGFQSCNFGIIDAYEISNTRVGGEKSYFIWSEMIFDSFQSGFIKKLDLDFYFSLNSAVSRRLYRYLDKHFYYRSVVEKPLTVLAFEKLGLSRSYRYISSLKQQLEPAAEELKSRGFIERFEVQGHGQHTVARFYQDPNFVNASLKKVTLKRVGEHTAKNIEQLSVNKQGGERIIDAEQKRSLIAALKNHGLTDRQLSRLLENKNSKEELAKIWEILSQFEQLQRSSKPFSNPVGFLYRAIENSEQYRVSQAMSNKEQSGIRSRKSISRCGNGTPSESSAAENRAELFRQYKQYLTEDSNRRFLQLSENRKEELKRTVEEKLACLKPILNTERFSEAVNGCILEEFRKGIVVPSFDRWISEKPEF